MWGTLVEDCAAKFYQKYSHTNIVRTLVQFNTFWNIFLLINLNLTTFIILYPLPMSKCNVSYSSLINNSCCWSHCQYSDLQTLSCSSLQVHFFFCFGSPISSMPKSHGTCCKYVLLVFLHSLCSVSSFVGGTVQIHSLKWNGNLN